VRIITEEEFERNKNTLREQLGRTARSDLEKWLTEENASKDEDYALLM
jgi:F0F1-type ATP synthase membrane subunit b/b'